MERAQRLVTWVNSNFEWKATDYVERTAEEIIERRGGNCAELSSVLERLLRPTGIEYRWIAEINLHPDSAERAADAAKLVAEMGARGSVFGRRHNDHRWLEIRDDARGSWEPADPSLGIVGLDRWLATRMALRSRVPPAVPAAAEILNDMVAVVAVLLPPSRDRAAVDLSERYLIEGFGGMENGAVRALPDWKAWERGVRELAPLAASAFAGKESLHKRSDLIAELGTTYERLRAELAQASVEPRSPR